MMKIRVLPRIFFEKIKGTAEEDRLLDHYRIISVNSSRGDDSLPPFFGRDRNHRHLLCPTFDDVCNEPDRKMLSIPEKSTASHGSLPLVFSEHF